VVCPALQAWRDGLGLENSIENSCKETPFFAGAAGARRLREGHSMAKYLN
jgi:hypothetical protein